MERKQAFKQSGASDTNLESCAAGTGSKRNDMNAIILVTPK